MKSVLTHVLVAVAFFAAGWFLHQRLIPAAPLTDGVTEERVAAAREACKTLLYVAPYATAFQARDECVAGLLAGAANQSSGQPARAAIAHRPVRRAASQHPSGPAPSTR